VSAEEGGLPSAVGSIRQSNCRSRQADLRTGVVVVDRESKPAKVLEHSIGDRTFLTGGTRHACELDEERGNFRQPVLHGPILEFPY
jgi:hypothetical protein